MNLVLKRWAKRYFGDPEALPLCAGIVLLVAMLYAVGRYLAPCLASLVIAYLLDHLASRCSRRLPRWVGVTLAYGLFVGLLAALLLILIPVLFAQLTRFLHDLPGMWSKGVAWLQSVVAAYPVLSSAMVEHRMLELGSSWVSQAGHMVLSASLASIPNVMQAALYMVVVPFLVFYWLRDKAEWLDWLQQRLPQQRQALSAIWDQVNRGLGWYIRGKCVETLWVGVSAYIVFLLCGLHYALLLSFCVGCSVWVPYVGAVVVTVPVAWVGLAQWGPVPQAWLCFTLYGMLQFLDSNVLAPVLFSEAVSIHPVSIVVSILLFGGLWGFWGVFFAIPLAVLCKAVWHTWPVCDTP